MSNEYFDPNTFEPHGLYRTADEGHYYKWGDASILVKLSPENTQFVTNACWRVTVPAGKSVDFMALSGVDRAYYCTAGHGQVLFNGEATDLSAGDVVLCGRGNSLEYKNTGESDLELMGFSIPAVPEVRIDVLTEGYELRLENLSEETRRAFGLLTRSEASNLDQVCRGEACVMGPDEGESFWQPQPSIGYVAIKTKPDYARKNNFGVALQQLEPGSYVQLHGHVRTTELIVCVKGRGTVYVEGLGVKEFSPGAIAMVGTRTFHNFSTTGTEEDGEMIVAALASPTEIGEALFEIGVRRTPGEPVPDNIERDMSKLMVLVQKYGFMLPDVDSGEIGARP
ncbi:cupin domain-containing protein [Kitasatospora purpeofusca]|uniref:cupin domain-containing protein n=1 Tax=Kitasatospora purpeofusca TaxID=67352 RepID=UPI0033D07B52